MDKMKSKSMFPNFLRNMCITLLKKEPPLYICIICVCTSVCEKELNIVKPSGFPKSMQVSFHELQKKCLNDKCNMSYPKSLNMKLMCNVSIPISGAPKNCKNVEVIRYCIFAYFCKTHNARFFLSNHDK